MAKNFRKHSSDRLPIVYEDQWVIVVDKPAGLLSMSTGSEGETTAYSILTDYVRSQSGGRVFIVHRLDRETSGLLLFAKDFRTKELLQQNWNETVLERKYIALLEGRIESEDGWIETWLRDNPKSMTVSCMGTDPRDDEQRMNARGWKYASSHCRKISETEIDAKAYTMVEFELETGRKNQIRVHSRWIGHPVAGDKKYGALTNPLGRLALHAQTLSFVHPHTGKTMTFSSKLPKGFRR
ncbi:MAG: RluA family pseudouridine synthase [Candidatus Cryptobacteroides sp.]